MQTKPKPTPQTKKNTPNKQMTLNPYCLVPVHMQRSTIVPEGKRTKILQDEEQNNTPTPKTKHKNQFQHSICFIFRICETIPNFSHANLIFTLLRDPLFKTIFCCPPSRLN